MEFFHLVCYIVYGFREAISSCLIVGVGLIIASFSGNPSTDKGPDSTLKYFLLGLIALGACAYAFWQIYKDDDLSIRVSQEGMEQLMRGKRAFIEWNNVSIIDDIAYHRLGVLALLCSLSQRLYKQLTSRNVLLDKGLLLPDGIIPVLQGYQPEEYVSHIRQYGDRLRAEMWVGVRSVCKRNSKPEQIEAVLLAIKGGRPDLRCHGFGVKLTALGNKVVRALLWSADSMAWSFAARRRGKGQNDWREARAFMEKVEDQIS